MNDELERLEGLLRATGARSMAATVAAGLAADGGWPAGGRAARLMARAREAAGIEATARARIVVRAIGQVIEVLSGGLAPAAVLRGALQEGVLVREQIAGHAVAAHIDLDDERFAMTLDLGDDAAARGVRVTLLAVANDGREVASMAATQGRVRLPEVAAGQWQVRLRDAAGWSGVLDLDLSCRAASGGGG